MAQQNGCIGLVLYSDPKDYAPENVDAYYPDTWWLPPTGVQRGSVKATGIGYGDPLTPGYAAIGILITNNSLITLQEVY